MSSARLFRNTLFGIVAVMCTFTQGLAQPIIAKADVLAMVGRSQGVEMDTTGNVTVNVGVASAQPQTWDFKSIMLQDPVAGGFEWLDPASTPFAANFPDANLSLKFSGVFSGFRLDLFLYFEVTDDAFINRGNAASLFGTTLIDIDNDRFGVLPLEFGKTWSDTSVTQATSPFGVVTDSLIAHSVVDAWGTVQLPGGDFECLRICTRDTVWSETVFNGQVTSRDTSSTIDYIWASKSDLLVLNVASQDNESDPNFTSAGTFVRLTESPSTGIAEEPGDSGLPTSFDLAQNYPNPFNPATTIPFTLGKASEVELAVYDLQGRLVKTLLHQTLPVGRHSVSWDGTDERGQPVASGRYVYRLSSDGQARSMIMVYVK